MIIQAPHRFQRLTWVEGTSDRMNVTSGNVPDNKVDRSILSKLSCHLRLINSLHIVPLYLWQMHSIATVGV